MDAKAMMTAITRERPVGTPGNQAVLSTIRNMLQSDGYAVESLPFPCMVWTQGPSTLQIGAHSWDVLPSPFSLPCQTGTEVVWAQSTDELTRSNAAGKILCLHGDIAKDALQPKDHPFYFPDEHRALLSLLETKRPAAVVAFTGAAAFSGQNPFPLLQDGQFDIPSCYLSETLLPEIRAAAAQGSIARLHIDSERQQATSEQLLTRKAAPDAKGLISILAHMDTQYDTPGALDNAVGVAVLLMTAARLKDRELPYDVDFVPVNGEESFAAHGEMLYLDRLRAEGRQPALVINIDSPCHIGAQTAVSTYNADTRTDGIAARLCQDGLVMGEPWYAGDHIVFAMQGIPALALASSDMGSGGLSHTHTPLDTLADVDMEMISATADALANAIAAIL